MVRTRLSLSRGSHLGPDRGNDAGRRANLITRNKPSKSSKSGKSGKSRTIAIPLAAVLVFVVQMTTVCVSRADAASGLKLAPQLSFDDDSSPNFPIQGENLSEGSIASGEATVIFFGTSNCWNTSREAERLVRLYPQFRNRIHFVIVDLNNVAPEQQALVSQYYHGYIPTIIAIDSKGDVIYDRAGKPHRLAETPASCSDYLIRFTSQFRERDSWSASALTDANPSGATI